MLSELKLKHREYMDAYMAKGGKVTEWTCQDCDNSIETPLPTPEQVTGKGFWDGMKECPECGAHNFVRVYPSGETDVQLLD